MAGSTVSAVISHNHSYIDVPDDGAKPFVSLLSLVNKGEAVRLFVSNSSSSVSNSTSVNRPISIPPPDFLAALT